MMFGYKETWVAMCFNERLDYQTEPGATITKMLLHYLTLLPVALAGGYKTPTAITINGTYRGRHLPEFSQDLFLGIPFARAPLLGNPLPWDESWKGSRSAEYNGAICHCYASPAEMERANVTEKAGECLNLNIIRPSGIDKKKLPVVVWLYGGGFVDGFGADINSNLSYIVQESVAQHMPIIAVTLNYRVGFLGFPGGAPVAEEGVTNLGFKDQRKALHWVQENIAGFGGDPDKVTLWGQSAGSHSITHQILAYGDQRGEKRLFRGAIMASSSVGVGNSHHAKRADALAGYRRILQATNCASAHDSLACLRGLSAGQLWEASLTTADLSAWGPMVDGDFVSMPPTIQLLSGKFRRDVSVLIGTNSDEGIRVANTIPEDLDTDQQVFSILKQLFLNARNETLDLIMRAYPADIPGPPYGLSMSDTDRLCEGFRAVGGLRCGTQFRRFAAMFGDFFVIAGQRAFAQAFAKFGLTAYSYRFDTWPTSFPITNFTNFKPGFASHSTEYSYFFRFPREHNLYGNNPPIPEGSRAHLQLSHGIAAKLIGYIYTGDPNAISVPGFPTWPKYDVRKPTNLVLNATEHPDRLNVHVEPDTWRKEGMAVWPSNPFELDYRRPVPEGYGSQ
ncbi:Alpha/Beta hydrolase protein [Triangularia verruculosa]|uniref:Carboxylic ester hydrolase n=1 Tax=Triangularia verruculosa TaxID=2587418 RepID=A0AAN6XPS2_9PEZI|nr:Alpha/Beta hydrolase protein [Triangularia verruculosa]